MDKSHRDYSDTGTYPPGCSYGQRSDLVERLLSKRLARFDEERRRQELRMEETVQDFAMRLLQEESKRSEEASGGEEGEQTPPEASKRDSEPEALIVALNAGLVKQLRTAAEECRITVSSLVESCVTDWLEGYERLKRKRRQIHRLL